MAPAVAPSCNQGHSPIMSRMPPHLVIDQFLPAELHQQLVAHVLAHENRFEPAKVIEDGEETYGDGRSALICAAGLGPLLDPFQQQVNAAVPQFCSGSGVPPFKADWLEIELAAHRDEHFFKAHTDTRLAENRAGVKSDRVLTLVYYFRARPAGFSRGELAVYPFGPGEPVLVQPLDNRMLAMPSFALHEVRPVSVPGNAFEDARFSINVWLHRNRTTGG